MEDLVAQINRALRERGWSARQASMEAVGAPELIRNIRRGHLPSMERMQALCEVLDLEFYIGPARESGSVDELRLEDAVDSTERTLQATGVRLDPRTKARAVVAIYELLDRKREPATAERIKRLIDALTSPSGGTGSAGEESEST